MVEQTFAVGTIKEYHEACIRNGLRVPDIKSRICTLGFLQRVRQGIVWVPKYSEIKLSPCPRPPTIKEIQATLIATMKHTLPGLPQNMQSGFDQLLIELTHRPADKSFMLDLLSTVTGGTHLFFTRDYVPHRKAANPVQFNNADGFFSNLPPSQYKGKRNVQYIYVMPEERERLKLQKLEEMEKRVALKLHQARQRLGQIQRQQFQGQAQAENVVMDAPEARDG